MRIRFLPALDEGKRYVAWVLEPTLRGPCPQEVAEHFVYTDFSRSSLAHRHGLASLHSLNTWPTD